MTGAAVVMFDGSAEGRELPRSMVGFFSSSDAGLAVRSAAGGSGGPAADVVTSPGKSSGGR